MNTRAYIDGAEVALRDIQLSEVNYGSCPGGQSVADYKVTITEEKFISVLSEPYASACEELKRDDALVNKTDFLGEAGYPPLTKLVRSPTVLTKVVDVYLATELFQSIAHKESPKAPPWKYLISTIASVKSDGATITIEGLCHVR